jgi:hypothetical protein
MKTKYLLIALLIASASQSCNKSLDAAHINLHSAKVLAATCALGAPASTEVAVQLDNKDPLSFTWTNPTNDSVYNNVVVTFNAVLRKAIGKSFTYSSVRTRNSTDTLANITLAICITYSERYFDNVTVKN